MKFCAVLAQQIGGADGLQNLSSHTPCGFVFGLNYASLANLRGTQERVPVCPLGEPIGVIGAVIDNGYGLEAETPTKSFRNIPILIAPIDRHVKDIEIALRQPIDGFSPFLVVVGAPDYFHELF